ncbi:hypothetical protein SAMN04488564_12314 [Lentzea waywayandensis]|uniref:Peptidase inhibitor family I36 n=1 Tax=Lentzea waywayandensis TaxID=84724 RepID=A0A1I6FIY2_9PSEU|nr:hypothetical protein [Lentzea waywayandensis]SFR29899.1 hypothetical protein SAMN04488564_12314 [Lentzea waywayandensis]
MKKVLKAGVVAGAVALCAALVPGVASATVRGQIDICNDSGVGVVVKLPERGGFSSYVVKPRPANGPCYPWRVGGGNAWEGADVYFTPNRYLVSFHYNPSRGAAVFVNDSGSVRVYN